MAATRVRSCKPLLLMMLFTVLSAMAQDPPQPQRPPPPGESDAPQAPGRPPRPQLFPDGAGPGRAPGRRGGPSSDDVAPFPRPPLFEPRVLVVGFDKMDATAAAEMDTDLNVMRIILERALDAVADRGPVSALGIPLSIRGGQGGAEAMYLEGYGAFFHLRAVFPLSPDAGAGEPRAGRPAGSVWEQTRREFLQRQSGAPLDAQDNPAYDAQRVQRLEGALAEALRHAGNIRRLRPEERITIVVTSILGRRAGPFEGPGPGTRPPEAGLDVRPEPPRTPRDGRPEDARDNRRPGLPPLSIDTLALSVTKADVDALTRGELGEEAFQKKIRMNASWERESGRR